MPILPAETDLYPPTLLEEPSPAAAGREWCVLRTRPRHEKSLARHLRVHEVPFYLPLNPHHNQIRGKVLTAHLPLFAGYLFLLATAQERRVALGTHRVLLCLKVPDERGLWLDLRQLRRLLEAGAAVTEEEAELSGEAVEVCSGPLAGLRGTLVRTAAQRRLVVPVNFIQRGASIELDDAAVVKALSREEVTAGGQGERRP